MVVSVDGWYVVANDAATNVTSNVIDYVLTAEWMTQMILRLNSKK